MTLAGLPAFAGADSASPGAPATPAVLERRADSAKSGRRLRHLKTVTSIRIHKFWRIRSFPIDNKNQTAKT